MFLLCLKNAELSYLQYNYHHLLDNNNLIAIYIVKKIKIKLHD